MLEPELGLGPPPALADQVEPLELEQRALHVALAARDRLEQRQAELPPQHGRRHQRVVRVGLQAVDPGEDDLLDGRRDLDLDRVVEPPPLALAHERPRVHERPHELLEEERVPLGRLEDPPLHLVRQGPGPDERVEQFAVGVARERLERDLAGPVRELARRALLHAPGRVVAFGSGGQDEQQRGRLGVLQQAFEQLERGRVGPVEVLEDDEDRPVLRQTRRAARGSRRRSGTGGPRARARPAVRAPRVRATARASRPGTGRPRAAGRRTARRASAAGPASRGARARPRGRRATIAGGPGTASTASIRRRRRTGPRSTAGAAGRRARPPRDGGARR